MIKGIKASDGLAIGRAKWLREVEISFEKNSKLSADEEIKRYDNAKEKGIEKLEGLRLKTLEEIGEHEAEVFQAHKLLLGDVVMEKEVLDLLQNGLTCEQAYVQVFDQYIETFLQLDNAYMRERALDLKDIKNNQLKILCGIEDETVSTSKDTIIVTYDLTPSETVKIDRKNTLGFITEIGGETSHSAIIARTMGIPAVVGTGQSIQEIKDNDLLIIDGFKGEVHINPSKALITDYEEKIKVLKSEKSSLEVYKKMSSQTKDGKEIEIACNIAGVDDLDYVLESTADGIGLFRSEFLYMNRDCQPTEEEQFLAYKKVLEAMSPKPVTIRTLDIGGDKSVPYMNLDEEMNPFLGFRAIRICLEDHALFKTQLKALLRASVYGKLRIMFPMISSLEELLEAKAVLKEVKEQVPNASYEVGIMIEIPAAALLADVLAEHVDFFSIGTNDLIQYTTAVDRMNAKVAKLYNPYNPALIRLLYHIIKAGNDHGIEVGMCGNVAGKEDFIPMLLDMGLKEFSMSPDMILKARKIVNNHTINDDRFKPLLKLSLAKEIEVALENY